MMFGWPAWIPPKAQSSAKDDQLFIVSPDQTNRHLRTVIACPMASRRRGWPTRVPVAFSGREGEIAGDQIRVLDKSRLIRRLGAISADEAAKLKVALFEMLG